MHARAIGKKDLVKIEQSGINRVFAQGDGISCA